MWKRLRGWHLVAALVAIAAAGTGIALYLSRGKLLDAPRMAAYFPERDAIVVYLDVAALRDSGVIEKIAGSAVREESEYREFVQHSGFDYKRDLDRAMVNSAQGIHYFLLQGRFDWGKLRAYAKQNGGSCDGDYCHVKGSAPDRVVSFRRLQDGLMAMATARDENGARALELRSAAALPFAVPGEPLWMHVPASAIQNVSQGPPGLRLFARALQGTERAIFSLGQGSGNLNLKMDVACSTPEQAAELRAQLEGITQLLQKLIAREAQKPNASDLSGVLTSGAFRREDKRVVGNWSVPRAFLENLGR